jgi:hypothetical protein
MTKIPQEHFDKLCTSKHPYTSEEDAKFKIKAARKKGRIVSPLLRPYKCRFCWAWHIGHIKTFDKNGNPI